MNEANNQARLLEQLVALASRAAYVCAHDYEAHKPVGTRLLAIADLKAEYDRTAQLLKEIQESGGRAPDAYKTAEDKHVGISDLLAGERVCEKDFVFLDHAYRTYRVRDVNGTLWLHYWHPDKKWVTKRTVSNDEAAQWIGTALKPSMAKLYEAGVPFLAS